MSQTIQGPGPRPAAPPASTRKPWHRRPAVVVALIVVMLAAITGAVLVVMRSNSSPAPSPTTAPTGPASQPATTAAPTTGGTGTGTTVVSSRLAYPWQWPSGRGAVTHTYRVPPVPKLVAIDVGNHPNDPGERPYNRMTFTFNTTFPSYDFGYTDKLLADGSGQPIPVDGLGVLKVTFRQAQAHTDDGTASTVTTQPPRHFGYVRMADYAQAGDFEGVLTYGIGIAWPIPQSNPQIPVRIFEIEKVTAQGQHLYVVAVDVDARQPATQPGISVSPSTVRAGGTVVFSGTVPTSGQSSCPAGGTVTLTSVAGLFPPDGFGPQLARNATGAFQTSYVVPTSTAPGTYDIGMRCGGGPVGPGASLVVM